MLTPCLNGVQWRQSFSAWDFRAQRFNPEFSPSASQDWRRLRDETSSVVSSCLICLWSSNVLKQFVSWWCLSNILLQNSPHISFLSSSCFTTVPFTWSHRSSTSSYPPVCSTSGLNLCPVLHFSSFYSVFDVSTCLMSVPHVLVFSFSSFIRHVSTVCTCSAAFADAMFVLC